MCPSLHQYPADKKKKKKIQSRFFVLQSIFSIDNWTNQL